VKTALKYSLVVVLAAVSLATSAYAQKRLTLKWASNVTAQTGLYESVLGGMNYADIDGDGTVDILLCRRKGLQQMTDRLVCLSGKTGAIQWIYPPPDKDNLPGDPMCVPAIDDLDGDGKLEVVAIGRNNWVHCFNVIGGRPQLKWQFTPEAGSDNSPTIFDIDGDGKKEVIFATGGVGWLYVLSHDGREKWRFQMAEGTNSGPTAWDVDKDGEVEILIPCQNGKMIYCLTSSGVEKWRFNFGNKPGQSTAAVGDIDKDGEYEILVMVPDELKLYCLTFFGTEKWTFSLDPTAAMTGWASESPSIGDIDGDGFLEVFVSDVGIGPTGLALHLYCLDYNGKKKWTAPAIAFTSLIGDFTGDGKMDVVGGRATTLIFSIDSKGSIEYAWDQLWVNPNIPVDPTVGAPLWGPGDVKQIMGDFDGDGKVEWAFVCSEDTVVYCFTAGGAYNANNMIWPRGYNTMGNVAVIPIIEGAILPLAAFGLLAATRKIAR